MTDLPTNHFVRGAQACREMMARFVESGGTEAERNIASSIRANWHPGWGEDPGAPSDVAATWEPSLHPEGEATARRFRRSTPRRGSKAELRRVVQMIERWAPVTEPVNALGQASFPRALMDSASDTIRAFLRAPTRS